MRATFRPLPAWPYPETSPRRSQSTFKVGYRDTLALLEREVFYLGGEDVVIGASFRERDLRLDGMPRADAREPSHPGIEVSFDSDHGRLTYRTDVCERWEHNVRSIALGLESLRAVDRYGITSTGQQYAGFVAIPADTKVGRGQALVERYGSIRAAEKATHPDTAGGDDRDFIAVQAYKKAQDG